MNYKSAIIIPYGENYTKKDFGAVSVWVSDFIKLSKKYDEIVFCKKKEIKQEYLTKNICFIECRNSQ